MKKNELGGLLRRLRKEAGFSQGLLCSGLCSVSRYALVYEHCKKYYFLTVDEIFLLLMY